MLNISGLKSRNMISLPLDLPNVDVSSVRLNEHGDYIITVESMQSGTICQHCGHKITKFHGHGRWIKLRHLSILGCRVYIRLRPKQYECPHCDDRITTQTLDWYETKSPHTKAYDRHLMLQLVNSTVEDVSRKEDVGYDAVEGAIERCIRITVNWDEFKELSIIGIDEIAMTKGRGNYVAIITTQQADGHVAVLAVLPDRKKETVRQFLETIPQRLWGTMETACTDMWEGYVNAVKEFAAAHPEVSIEVVVDRYHVAKNYRECVDEIRKRECRRLKKELSETEYEEIKGVMWGVRKNNENLTSDERKKLNRLFDYSPELKLAYTFREELTAIFEMRLTKEEAKKRLLKWADKVRRSVLTCFDQFLKTLDNWLDEIVNYFVNRLSSGFVEGLNNKVKTIKRRCYGILRVTTLFQRLYLDLEGYRRFA
ncbi:MAG: ISL3 family transposase [Planctomycetota bacterium]|nr:MAG: ISL3 family transposase [Planctomycetota bacterium]